LLAGRNNRQNKLESAKNTASGDLNFPPIQVFLGSQDSRIGGIATAWPTRFITI
jgi:hypothetical protein